MKLVGTPLAGLFVVELEPIVDDRGFFARSYCAETFRAHGLHTDWPQSNVSFNLRRGTLRGMHYQRAPHEEVKIVRCTRGRIFDVAVDLRPGSPTWRRWFGVELTEENREALYVPAGFAHGFQTLVDGCEVLYQMGDTYHPDLAAGVRWDDPALGVIWPIADPVVSAKDRAYESLPR